MTPSSRPLTRLVDLNLLELFDVVYRTRNLTAAGRQLGLSQSAVSYGLGRLREMYGDALFVRTQRGVQPTPFADGLTASVAQVLDIVRRTIEKPQFVPGEAQRDLRVAMSDIGERFFLPRLSEWLGQKAPGIAVETTSPGLPELADGLASGEIDLAVGYFPGLGKQVHQQKLFEEHFVYLMRRQHPEVGRALTLEQVRRLRHAIASPPSTDHATALDKVLANRRVRARIALRVSSFLSLGPIVGSTDLAALVPSNLAAVVAASLELHTCEAPFRLPRFDVCIYWHQRFHQDPANQWMRSLLVHLFHEKPN